MGDCDIVGVEVGDTGVGDAVNGGVGDADDGGVTDTVPDADGVAVAVTREAEGTAVAVLEAVVVAEMDGV